MERDAHKTIAIFRAEKSGAYKGTVTAVFPEIAGTYDWHATMACYEHVGQHSTCTVGWYQTTRAAKPHEYEALRQELESIGYNLDIRRRMPANMREARCYNSRGTCR